MLGSFCQFFKFKNSIYDKKWQRQTCASVGKTCDVRLELYRRGRLQGSMDRGWGAKEERGDEKSWRSYVADAILVQCNSQIGRHGNLEWKLGKTTLLALAPSERVSSERTPLGASGELSVCEEGEREREGEEERERC